MVQSVRQNLATKSVIDKSKAYATGGFKVVYKGKYTKGERSGQACVSKEFLTGQVFEDSYFDHELKVVERTLEIITKWNEGRFIDKQVMLNQPTIWHFDSNNARNLVEPFIENFEKFNSNSGWVSKDGTPWCQVMQALSHFSYHQSGGQLLICDLQGGIYSKAVILTDPVVMSLTRCYGPTDLGPLGIDTFFARHTCNQFCRSHWKKPLRPQSHHPQQQGTSMMRPQKIPTDPSRPDVSIWKK